MALTNTYLVTTKNLESIFNSILSAKPPERFSSKFLSDLGFTSSNDRLYIGVLKAIGFLDENSGPTQRYYDFLDQSQSKKVVAEGVREAYEDIFNLKVDAQNMTNDEFKNKLKTLTQGQKNDKIMALMTSTFRALCDYAEWTSETSKKKASTTPKISHTAAPESPIHNELPTISSNVTRTTDLHYNIQIHLPETRDMAVYDAIFQSLKKHLI